MNKKLKFLLLKSKILKNKKGFVWYLFQQEFIFFAAGFGIALVFMLLWAFKIIPIPYDICKLKFW